MELDPHRYDDMLDLPHHTSEKHPRMSSINRAAQFSPFAALTGYEGQIADAQVFRCNRIILSEEEQQPINEALSRLKKGDCVTVTFFETDPGTNGSGLMADGNYVQKSGIVLRFDPIHHTMRIDCEDGSVDIVLDDIIALHIIESHNPAAE